VQTFLTQLAIKRPFKFPRHPSSASALLRCIPVADVEWRYRPLST